MRAAPLSASPLLLLASALAVAGCGNPSTQTVIVAGPALASGGQVATTEAAAAAAPPFCGYQGAWHSGVLRAPRGGFPAVRFLEAQARMQIDRADGPLRVHAELAAGGWHFLGSQDPAQDHPLRARGQLALSPGLVLQAGSYAQVLDARPGELLLGPAIGPDALRLLARPATWFPCEALTLQDEQGRRGAEERRRGQRTGMGLPADPPPILLSANASAPIAVQPGAAPFAQLLAGEHPRSLLLLERGPEQSRVLLHHWDGAMVIGWVPSASLSEPEEGGGEGAGILGALAGQREIQVCQTREQLPVLALHEGVEPELIGAVEAGAPFLLREQRENGLLVIGPIPGSPFSIPSETVWVSRATVAPQCERRTYDPSQVLRDMLMGPPLHRLRVNATVTALTGLGGVGVGGRCEGELLVRDREQHACRLELRCGGHLVYGTRDSNGYFDCELTQGAPGGPPLVRGRDTNTTEADGQSGDPAMSIDTGARSLSVEDDASGSMGSLRLEARIDAITPVER